MSATNDTDKRTELLHRVVRSLETYGIAEVHQRLGVARADARARAGLLVSGLRGPCQDRIVTGDSNRIDAATHLLVDSAASLR